jgi:O-antigen/teichoic acid export membrane protein
MIAKLEQSLGRLTRGRINSTFLMRLLGSALLMQAVLSGSSLFVGLVLLRRTADLQYGYYVLIQNAILLMIMMQGSFIQPQLVTRISSGNLTERADLVGGLYRSQQRICVRALAAGFVLTLVLCLTGVMAWTTGLLLLAAAMATFAALYREFFRMVLLGHRRPVDVLSADAIYAALFVAGSFIATFTAAPAAVAVFMMAFAALVGGQLCARALWRFEPWNETPSAGTLRSFAPLGAWSSGGAMVHWLSNQGYSYLVAAMLSVQAVAAIAATRLTIMPINLISTGIGTVMLPTTAAWMESHGPARLFRRSLAFALLLSMLALCYFVAVWFGRDWLFEHVLKKEFAHRDTLLLMWFAASFFMLFRDQMLYLLTLRHRFRRLATLSFVNALLSLPVSYFGMMRFGVFGALLGMVAGEVLNVCALIVLSIVEIRGMVSPTPA